MLSPKWIYFPILVRYNISNTANLQSPLSPLLVETGIYTHTDFFVGNLILNNFYLKQFFVIIGNLGSIQPYSEFSHRSEL